MMRIRASLFFIFSLVSSFSFSSIYAEPKNLHWDIQALMKYKQSGAYQRDINQVVSQARAYLTKAIMARTAGQSLAIILDIDETALSNFKAIQVLLHALSNVGDTLTPSQIAVINHPFNDPANPAVLSLYRYALAHDVAVFFVTGRGSKDLQGTISNLHRVGYSRWTDLVLRQPNQMAMKAAPYKQAIADRIAAKGYDIVLSLGDQWSDLPKYHVQKGFKLPNPYYFIA